MSGCELLSTEVAFDKGRKRSREENRSDVGEIEIYDREQFGLDGFTQWTSDEARCDAYESIQSNVIGCMSPGKCVKDDLWIQGLCYMDDEHELDIPQKPASRPNRKRPTRRRVPGRPRPKEIRKQCNVHGCSTLMKGRVLASDKYGVSGVRCVKHGGGRRCNVHTCNNYAQCTVVNADELGEPGGRCRVHSRLQRDVSRRHSNQETNSTRGKRIASPKDSPTFPSALPPLVPASSSMFPEMSPASPGQTFSPVFAPELASPLDSLCSLSASPEFNATEGYHDSIHRASGSHHIEGASDRLEATHHPSELGSPSPEISIRSDSPELAHSGSSPEFWSLYPGSAPASGSASPPPGYISSPSTSTCASRYPLRQTTRRRCKVEQGNSRAARTKRRRRATENLGCGVPSCKREPRKLESSFTGPIYCAFHTPCCVPGCRTPGRGVVREMDQFGAPGRRCRRHGAGSRCAVDQCLTLARERTLVPDKYGPRGVRCLRHYCGVPSRSARCNIPGCTTSDEGRVLVADHHGPPGLRCKKHGGAKRCNVEGCNCNAKGKVDEADEMGPEGYRCKKHGGGPRCNVFGCGEPSKGKVYVHDTLGAVGFRCADHGGSSRSCNIICV